MTKDDFRKRMHEREQTILKRVQRRADPPYQDEFDREPPDPADLTHDYHRLVGEYIGDLLAVVFAD